MMALSSFRAMLATLALGVAVQSGAGLAQETGVDEVSAVPIAKVDLIIGDAGASVLMPCEEPAPGPPGRVGFQSNICIVGDQMFVFASAEGEDASSGGPIVSDFDAAYDAIESSRDTILIDQEEVDGRRTVRATRGPDPNFGIMQAIELREDAVVYAIAMSRPNLDEPLSDEEKQVMREFVESLEIVQ